jgi:hypothetical protein
MGLLLNDSGLPPGGAPGAVLTKVGSADFEASWLISKPAEGSGGEGIAGPQGPAGPQGEPGPRGFRGAEGPAGPPVETNEGFY